jgi:protein SCO1/2
VLKFVGVFLAAALAGLSAGAIATGTTPLTLFERTVLSGSNAPVAGGTPWDETFFPNVPVQTHDGRTLRFYDDLVRNKIVVVNFIYTSCSNICPLVTSRLALVKDMLGDRVGRDIFFLSISIDPLNDTPATLKKYAETYRAGPGWTFITGDPEHMDVLRAKLGERSSVKAEHRNDIMIGNDRIGRWGRDSAFSNIEVLAETIQEFDPAWVKPIPERIETSALPVNYSLHDKPGSFLFAKACGGCHSIGHGDIVGPDLAGVLDRRDHEWLRRFLREPDRMRAEKDPLTVELDEKYPGAKMPNLNLSNSDVDDLFAYLLSQGAKETSASGGAKIEAAPPNATSHAH